MADTNNHIQTVTIANGSSISGMADFTAFNINKDNYRLSAIVIPSDWTAANLTFQFSIDGGFTWVDMRDADGNEVTAAVVAANTGIVLLPEAFGSITHLKVRSGTSSVPVNQGADRSIALISRKVW